MARQLFDFDSPPQGMDPFAAEVDQVEIRYNVFVGGDGPAVILVHEIDGMGTPVRMLAEYIAEQGFTVYVPHFFSKTRQGIVACLRKEFVCWCRGETSPITRWLGALAREAHSRDDERRMVGIIGMCFSGGFALATLATGLPVTAAVAAQPATPWAGPPMFFTQRRQRDLGLSTDDLLIVKDRLSEHSARVLPVRFEKDWQCPRLRVEELTTLEGADAVYYVEGRGHPTLTKHFRRGSGHPGSLQAIDSVVDWLKSALIAPTA